MFAFREVFQKRLHPLDPDVGCTVDLDLLAVKMYQMILKAAEV